MILLGLTIQTLGCGVWAHLVAVGAQGMHHGWVCSGLWGLVACTMGGCAVDCGSSWYTPESGCFTGLLFLTWMVGCGCEDCEVSWTAVRQIGTFLAQNLGPQRPSYPGSSFSITPHFPMG